MRRNTFGRLGLAIGIVAASAALLPAAAFPARASSATSLVSLQAGVLYRLNLVRRDHHLVPLKLDPRLSAAATAHTSQMLADGYFDHSSAGGQPFWQRIREFYSASHYSYWSVGENLLWTNGRIDGTQALTDWMNSPEHRANILTPEWREIGIAAQFDPNAPGAYGHSAVTVVATDFGVRH